MKALRVLVRIRLAEIVRRPGGAFWFFALPLLLIGIFSLVFQDGHPFERRRVAVVGPMTEVQARLAAPIATGGITLRAVESDASARARLETRDVSAIVHAGERGALRVMVGERESVFGQGLVVVLGDAKLETVPLPAIGYVRFLVPGMLAQCVVLAGLFGMGYAMVRYRQSRFLRKLATTPLSRVEFVLSQIVARVVLVVLQLLVILVVVRFAFGIPLSVSGVVGVVVVGAVGLVTFMGIGFLVSCVVKTEDVVVDIINAVSVPIALLSETFFSLEELPRPLAILASALPSTQIVRAMRAVLLHGEATMVIATPIAILLGWAAASFVLAVKVFDWR